MFFDFRTKTAKLSNWIFDILFPRYCLSCGREGFCVCPECFVKITIQKNFYCYLCGRRSPIGKSCPECKSKIGSAMTGLLVAGDWNNLLVRQMIYECKYRFIKELTLPLAAILIKFLTINYLTDWPDKQENLPAVKLSNWPSDKLILVPVPLHKRRLSWRGFNQSLLITQQINTHLKIPVIADLLLRTRHTPPQMDINNKIERIENVASAFSLNPEYKNKPVTCEQVKGKIVILIDDVCTTGSTLEECARALKPLRPKEIWGLVIARG
jgi:competence protein ComFC